MGGRTKTPLRQLLDEEGRKQSWLAARTGLHTSRVSLIVNGLHPTQAEAEAIAQTLGRDIAELWPDGATEPVA